MGTGPFLDSALDEILFLMAESLSLYSGSAAFPEMAVPALHALKSLSKHARVQKFKRGLTALLEKVKQSQETVLVRRAQIDFAPREVKEMNAFNDKGTGPSPLVAYVGLQRKVREARSGRMSQERKDEEAKKQQQQKQAAKQKAKGRKGGDDDDDDGDDDDQGSGGDDASDSEEDTEERKERKAAAKEKKKQGAKAEKEKEAEKKAKAAGLLTKRVLQAPSDPSAWNLDNLPEDTVTALSLSDDEDQPPAETKGKRKASAAVAAAAPKGKDAKKQKRKESSSEEEDDDEEEEEDSDVDVKRGFMDSDSD